MNCTAAQAIRNLIDAAPGRYSVDFAGGLWHAYDFETCATSIYATDGALVAGPAILGGCNNLTDGAK